MKGLILIYGIIAILGFSCSEHQQVSDQPNIVLILADDLGYSDIQCYGAVKIETPNIDKLASEGIRLTRFYNNAKCSPSRASLLTGLYPQEVGMGALAGPKIGSQGPYQGYLNDQCVTIAEVLKHAGYITLMSGKWHLGEHSQYWPMHRGFDHYFGLISGAANYFDLTKTKVNRTKSDRKIVRHMALEGQPYIPPKNGFYMTRAITNHALDMLSAYSNKNTPFFLYLSYTAPHWPLQALPEDIAKFKGVFMEGWDSLRSQRFRHQQALGIIGNKVELSPRNGKVPAWSSLTVKQQREMADKMAVYAAQIYRMDQGIGRVLKKIEMLGKEENTIVIFLSDNGACAEGGIRGFNRRHNGLPPGGENSYMSYGSAWANASNTPFRYFKNWLHEGGTSTPFIMKWPTKIGKNRQGDIITQAATQSAHVIDVLPTICDITGIPYPEKFKENNILPLEGSSILPLLEGNKDWKRVNPLYWAYKGHKAMLMGNWKLDAVSMDAPWELYNMQNDRSELNNVAGKYPNKVQKMGKMWLKWANRVGVFQGQEKYWHINK